MSKRVFFVAFFILFLLFGQTGRVFALTPAEQEAQWRADLAQTEADIAKWQGILNSTKANTKSLQQEAAVLNAKIQQAKALIKQKNIAIAQLDQDIADKNKHIQSLESQIDDGHESMAQLLRKTNQIDVYSLPELISLSKFVPQKI